MNPTRRRSLRRRGAALGVTAVVSSCGAPVDPVNPIADSSAATSQPAVASNETAPRATTTVPTASISPSPVTAVSSTTTGPSEQLIDEIEGLLDAAMAPGAIAWDCCGADAPPTGAVAAVRRPGEPDVVVTWGTSVDGTAYDGAAPFNVAGLTSSLVATLGFQLVDDGTLDPAATIERWLPNQPNADRITVAMLLDSTHGWASWPETTTDLIVADLTRSWTLAEVLASVEGNPPLAEPGTLVHDVDVGLTALAYIAEQASGSTLAELVAEHIARPAQLDGTAISDGDEPAGFEEGVLAFNGQRVDTSAFPHTSYSTYYAAARSANSTVHDLLDLLDVWRSGGLFTTARLATAERFPIDRLQETPESPHGYVMGDGIPFVGFCPCAAGPTGLSVTAIGRTPTDAFTDTHLLSYDDGISVVLHVNSGMWRDRAPLTQLVHAIHRAAT